jgi:two-component system chemotaxis response regulator CheY
MSEVDAEQLKVLVVDDHLTVRTQIQNHLKGMKFSHVDQAANVDEATNKMAATRYNIVFLDWHMPGKSGYYLLQKCREDRAYDDVAFIVVSAESENRHIIEALKAGATSYIVKPYSENTLVEHVTKTLNWIGRNRAKA